MKNFSRALRLSLQYPWTIAGAVLCSLLVAVTWGGNIAAVGPIVQVVFDEDGGRSLQEWIDQQLAETQARIDEFRAVTQEPRPDGEPELQWRRRRDAARSRLDAEEAALRGYQRLHPWIHRYLPNDPFQTLVVIIAALVAATILKDVFLVLGNVLTERVAQKATYNLRNQFYGRTLELDVGAFSQSPPSDWIARMTTDVTGVTLGLRMFYGRAIREPLKALACVAGAMYICWRLFLVSLILAPVSAFLIQKLTRLLKRASRRALEEVAEIYNVLTETYGSLKIVKAFTMEEPERERFRKNTHTLYRKSMRISWLSSFIRPASEMMGILIVAVALLSGAYLWLNQETHLGFLPICNRPLSLTQLLVFFGFLAGISDPARKLSDVVAQIQTAAAAADRVYEMLDQQPQVVDRPCPKPLPRHQTDLVFRGINFQYSPERPVLQGIHLRIPFGETVAIVGPNGCGKSTLAHLVLRFYDPQEGAVLLDGVDMRDVRRQDLRRQIGLVTQEAVVFNDTVMNNIRYGSPQATEAEVIAAAEKAHADGFIREKLDNGYHSLVGTNGGRLSGGQRQRLALARAILRDPTVLILDEATSQVDLESEQLIQRTLAEFIRDRTTLIITHRMGVLALADRIVVMDQGQIVDQGTHYELIQRCEIYQRLYQADFRQTA